MSTTQSHRPTILTVLSRCDAYHRLLISLGVALVCYLSFLGHMHWGKDLILSWDVFSFSVLVLAWARILTAQPKVVLRTARLQHSTRKWIFLFVLAAACASLGAVFFLLRPAKSLSPAQASEHIALALATVLVSWALIHTVFTLQYAFLSFAFNTAVLALGINIVSGLM